MANDEVDLYVSAAEVLETHEPARLLSERELEGACREATRTLRRRGYIFGFRDSTPYWIHEFKATGRNRIALPHLPVLSLVKVESVLEGVATEEPLEDFFIEDQANGIVGATAGWYGSEDPLSAASERVRAGRDGNPSAEGLFAPLLWRITYTGGTILTEDGRDVALQLAKIRVDEIRAVAAPGEFATTDGFTQARARLLADWPQRIG